MKRKDSNVIPESGFHTCEATGTCEPAQYVDLLCNAWNHQVCIESRARQSGAVNLKSLALSTCVRCVEV